MSFQAIRKSQTQSIRRTNRENDRRQIGSTAEVKFPNAKDAPHPLRLPYERLHQRRQTLLLSYLRTTQEIDALGSCPASTLAKRNKTKNRSSWGRSS
ncbi:hypothetical protein BDFB_009698 [Asbolus verrucosus]|uniref:Uncharacterized protein n=1 Tax=Asbolus verrucosus TaxID=1661398 RepID=A0A482VRI1_ASBVE|nr:hypothetical protein BDFB_009698 [Asbolus verrucosus]